MKGASGKYGRGAAVLGAALLIIGCDLFKEADPLPEAITKVDERLTGTWKGWVTKQTATEIVKGQGYYFIFDSGGQLAFGSLESGGDLPLSAAANKPYTTTQQGSAWYLEYDNNRQRYTFQSTSQTSFNMTIKGNPIAFSKAADQVTEEEKLEGRWINEDSYFIFEGKKLVQGALEAGMIPGEALADTGYTTARKDGKQVISRGGTDLAYKLSDETLEIYGATSRYKKLSQDPAMLDGFWEYTDKDKNGFFFNFDKEQLKLAHNKIEKGKYKVAEMEPALPYTTSYRYGTGGNGIEYYVKFDTDAAIVVFQYKIIPVTTTQMLTTLQLQILSTPAGYEGIQNGKKYIHSISQSGPSGGNPTTITSQILSLEHFVKEKLENEYQIRSASTFDALAKAAGYSNFNALEEQYQKRLLKDASLRVLGFYSDAKLTIPITGSTAVTVGMWHKNSGIYLKVQE